MHLMADSRVNVSFQGSVESNYSQHSSDLSLEEDSEGHQRETERHAIVMLDKARVSPYYTSFHNSS